MDFGQSLNWPMIDVLAVWLPLRLSRAFGFSLLKHRWLSTLSHREERLKRIRKLK